MNYLVGDPSFNQLYPGSSVDQTLVFQNPPNTFKPELFEAPKGLQNGGVWASFHTDPHKVFGCLGKQSVWSLR